MTGFPGWPDCPKCASPPKQEKYDLPTARQSRFRSSPQHFSSVLHFRSARHHQTSHFPLILLQSASQFLPPGIRLSGEQACYQRHRHSYLLHLNREGGEHSRNSLARRLTYAQRASVISVPPASSVTVSSPSRGNQARPHVDEAFVTANLMAVELQGLSGRVPTV
jgi:hypothetical protein